MQTPYIYSVSRVNTLEQFLLTKTDIERLLVSESDDELHTALKETYLAPFVAQVPDEDVSLAIEKTLIDAKKLIHRISPHGDMLRVLWIQYDIHNLRVFAKAEAAGLSFEGCVPHLSKRGVYDYEYLYKNVENSSLNNLQSDWQVAYNKAAQAVTEGKLDIVDGIFDNLYFETSKQIVQRDGDAFIKKYFSAVIDLYNLKSRLRHLKNETVKLEPAFVEGGTFSQDKIESLDDTLAAFSNLGGESFWKEAIDYYQEIGNTTSIDVRSAEYLLTVAKEASFDMFSSASLVLYYLKCRQAAANIRIITVGKSSGMKPSAIRSNLRMAYVNE